MEKFYIISPYDCLVNFEQNQIFLPARQTLAFDEEGALSIYPTQKNCPSFVLNSASQEDTQFYDLFEHEDKKYFLLKEGSRCQNFLVHEIQLDEGKCITRVGQNQVEIEYGQHKKVVTLENKFEKYKLGRQGNFVWLLLSCLQSEDLLLFNVQSAALKLLSGDEVVLNGGRVSVTKNYQNIARQVVTEEYLLTQDEIVLQNRQIGYQSRPVPVDAPQVVPHAFLQALQVDDVALAYSYLDIPLRRKIDQEHLAAYFGNITQFFQTPDEKFVVLGEQRAIFQFEMNENKISEIEKL